MDTENELKFLLPLEFSNASLSDWEKTTIMQGYLNEAITTIFRDDKGRPTFKVTVSVNNGDNIIFQTHEISEYQFEKLNRDAKSNDDGSYTLPESTRIRNKSSAFSLTYKQWVDDELIEVEDKTKFTGELFNKLQPHASDFVYKDRYEKQIEDEEWVVDYLKDYKSGDVYYVHSEVEMPYGRKEPKYMPSFIKGSIIFYVPQNDTRFVNQQLANKIHASSLYRKYSPQ